MKQVKCKKCGEPIPEAMLRSAGAAALGRAGTGAAKARTSEQARKAAAASAVVRRKNAVIEAKANQGESLLTGKDVIGLCVRDDLRKGGDALFITGSGNAGDVRSGKVSAIKPGKKEGGS